MQINVAQLLKEVIGSVRDCEVAGAVDITDSGTAGAVSGKIGLMRTDRGILVRGRLHTEAEVTCGRCLEPFPCPLDCDIEEEYFPTVDMASGAPVATSGEPGNFTIDENNIIDLAEAMRQYALLVIPMKPLCHPDCAGLCPECGRNLNLGGCGCPAETVDPRWTELAGLTGDQKGKG